MHKKFAFVPRKTGIFLILVSLFFCGTLTHAQTPMSDTDASALRTKVKEVAEKTKTISSDFTQYKHIDFLSDDIESKGRLAFKAPDMVKWEYTKPFAYAVLFKNNSLYINDEGKKNSMDLNSNKIFQQLNELITSSISGDMFDEAQFKISYFSKEENSIVHFTPKNEQFSEFIKVFHLTFNNKGEVVQVKMIEPSGDYTKIVFSNRSTNPTLTDADFSH